MAFCNQLETNNFSILIQPQSGNPISTGSRVIGEWIGFCKSVNTDTNVEDDIYLNKGEVQALISKALDGAVLAETFAQSQTEQNVLINQIQSTLKWQLLQYGNLLDISRAKENWIINSQNINGTSSDTFDTSEPIEINHTDTFKWSGTPAYLNYYTSEMIYISTQIFGSSTNINLDVPENAKYIVISYNKTNTNKKVLANMNYYIGAMESTRLNYDIPLYSFNKLILKDENFLDNTVSINKLEKDIQNIIRHIDDYVLSEYGNQIDPRIIKEHTLTNATYPNGTYNENLFSTQPIEVDASLEYKTSGAIAYFNWYDENMTYISTNIQGNLSIMTLNPPENTKYVIVSSNNQNLNTIILATSNYIKGLIAGTAQLEYVPALYNTKSLLINNDNILDNTINESKLSLEVQAKLNGSSGYFANKTINFLGDSITYGYDGQAGGGRVENPYPSIVKDLLKFNTCNNYGINGSTITGNDELGVSPMNIRYSSMSEADYVIVFAGTNDHGQNMILGTPNDITNSTFYGSLDILIKGLINKYPKARIAFITPLRKSNISANSNGNSLEDFVNVIKEKCKEYAIPILDFYNLSGCIPQIANFKTNNLPDGLHPNQDYYYVLAKKIAHFIESL